MKRALLAAAVLLLTACGGGGGSSVSPPANGGGSGTASVQVTIRLDATTAQAAKRRPAYLSAATQSITISVNGGTPVAQSLTPAGGNCSTPSFGATPVCTLVATAPLGNDTFTFVTYDAANGTGNRLSQNTIVQQIVSGSTNTVAVVLDAVPAGILVTPYPNQSNVIGQGAGYALTGTTPANFAVVALDADKELIVGPGAPSLTVTSSSPNLHVTAVANNPNEYTLTPVTDGATVTLNVSAAGGNGGSASGAVDLALQFPIPTSLPAPLYVFEAPQTGSAGEIDIFPAGSVNNATPARLTSTALSTSGGSLAADANGTVYAEADGVGADLYSVVSFNSTAIGLNATPTTEINEQYRGGPFATAYSMTVGFDHKLYVDAGFGLEQYGIFILQPGATGNATGQYQSIYGSATTLSTPNANLLGIAVDSAGYIYVAVNATAGSSIAVFAPGSSGNVAPARIIKGSNVGFTEPVVIGVASDGTLYVLDYGSAIVYAFAAGANGNVQPVRAFESPSMPYHGPMAVDQNGNVYGLNESSLIGVFPIIVFGSGASGLVNPLFQLSGSNTGINEPQSLSLAP